MLVNKSASAQKWNVSLKPTDDSTPPVTVPPATECNCELFLSLITIIGCCPALYQIPPINATLIEHLLT